MVLPFANIGSDPEQEYFSDGMTEEIINALANVEGLKVISRTSSFFFKGKDVDLPTIGEKLNVNNVLEGSVRKAGNKLRITAQLIKVADGTHLWSETYDRELEDVFAIQDEISKAIVDNLKIRFFGKEKDSLVKTHTKNIDAYEAYIRGRYYYLNFMENSMDKALRCYNQAIELDPDFAPAYSAIAEFYWALPFTGQKLSEENFYAKARDAINTALEIDNDLSEVYANLGLIKMLYEWDWDGAEKAFETAINLNPGLSKSHYDYAIYLAITGKNVDRAISEALKAVELDPLYGIPHYNLGYCLYAAGRYDQALGELHQALEMMPTFLSAYTAIALTYYRKGMLDEAQDIINKGFKVFPENPLLLTYMGFTYAKKGEKDKAREILNELHERSKKEYISLFCIALLYTHLGEIDNALEYLEEGYEKHDIYFIFIKTALHHSLITDPRFNAFLRKIGL